MVITIINEKGGVGKTTTSVNLGGALAEDGESVLLVDLDRQRNLSSFKVAGTDQAQADAGTLASVLHQAPDPGFTLLDCPPSLGDETVAALQAADVVIVPLQAEYLALQGLAGLLQSATAARDKRRGGKGAGPVIVRILITMLDGRSAHCAEVEAAARQRFGEQVFASVIRRSILFSDAALHHQSILDFAPKSPGAIAYRKLAQEVKTLCENEIQG